MSDIRDEWIKLVLGELRKNNDKVDSLRTEVYDRLDRFDEKVEDRLDKSSDQHLDLFKSQEQMLKQQIEMKKEHTRMNDLLEEHIRRTEQNEQMIQTQLSRIEGLEENLQPLVKSHNDEVAVDDHNSKVLKRNLMILGGIGTVISITIGVLKLIGII
jgi:hypothetical protein